MLDDLGEPALDPVIGPELAAARTRLGLSVDQLADRTRIRPHVIESIEVDDFAPCGGDFYARGHLRTLARVLGVDVDAAAGPLRRAVRRRPDQPASGLRGRARLGRRPIRATRGGPNWSVLIAAVMALVLAWSVARLITDSPVELRDPVPQLSTAGSDQRRSTRCRWCSTAAGGGAEVVVRDGANELVFKGSLAFGETKALTKVSQPVRVSPATARSRSASTATTRARWAAPARRRRTRSSPTGERWFARPGAGRPYSTTAMSTQTPAAPDQHRPPPDLLSVAMVTLGCARNEVDSEELAGRLEAGGFRLVDDASQADTVVVNTCGFVEAAKKDSVDTLLQAADLKTEHGGRAQAVVAVGCLAERYGKDLAESLPEADAVLGFDDYPDIAARLRSIVAGETHQAHTPQDRRRLLPISPVERAATELAVPGHGDVTTVGQGGPATGPRAVRRRLDSGPMAPLKLASRLRPPLLVLRDPGLPRLVRLAVAPPTC